MTNGFRSMRSMPVSGRELSPADDASVRRLRVGERLVELRRSGHRELVRSALEPLLRMLAGRLEVQHAVVADHREREGMRDARVLDTVEQERRLGAVEDAALGDDT